MNTTNHQILLADIAPQHRMMESTAEQLSLLGKPVLVRVPTELWHSWLSDKEVVAQFEAKRYVRAADGSGAGLGDRFGHAAWRAGVVMTVSNSTGVRRPSAACLRRRW